MFADSWLAVMLSPRPPAGGIRFSMLRPTDVIADVAFAIVQIASHRNAFPRLLGQPPA